MRFASASLVVFVLSFFGCGEPTPAPCVSRADCPFGELCDASGTCVPDFVAPPPPDTVDETAAEGEGEGAPVDEPPDAACTNAGPQVLHLDGDAGDFVHPGVVTITAGEWSSIARNDSTLSISVTPSDGAQGSDWSLILSTSGLNAPLLPGFYDDAQRASAAEDGHPGLQVFGDNRGCSTVAGSFEITEVELDSAALEVVRLSASFSQFCEAGSAELRGCIHYER